MNITIRTLLNLDARADYLRVFVEIFGREGAPSAREVFEALASQTYIALASQTYIGLVFWLGKNLPGFISAVGDCHTEHFQCIVTGHASCVGGNALVGGTATVYATEQARVFASEQAHVEASGDVFVDASGEARVRATGQAFVEASGQARVEASEQAYVEASGQAHVRATVGVFVDATEQAVVVRVD